MAWLETGPGAVFVGDLMHTPLQISHPDDACSFDVDTDQARTSRHAVLHAAACTGAAIFPAHFAGHGATTITSKNDTYEIGQWKPFPPI